jgi:hypothetical protein
VNIGWVFLGSMFLLTGIVVAVYSAAQEAFAPLPVVVRQALRRTGKLLGVLAVLAVAVFFLSKI